MPVLPVFIFDTEILNKLGNKKDKRIEFIHNSLNDLNRELKKYKSSLLARRGKPLDLWKKLLREFNINAVYANHEYEPYAINRDNNISRFLASRGTRFYTYKDQVIFETDEILNKAGKPYTVFTPYAKAWLEKLKENSIPFYSTAKLLKNFFRPVRYKFPSLKDIGFTRTGTKFPSNEIKKNIIRNYHRTRDFPSIEGTSRLSVHLRFGTISIRKLVKEALKLNETWLKELIWREFFMQILYHFPHVESRAFRKEYDKIKWRNNKHDFDAWRTGKTGYPIVDAGMRELNQTGYMHNRVRMITASFLCKHLLINWRRGEKYFAEKLLDYELSSNNGNWQWAAGTGCDAAPYFRVFNPLLQAEKYDSDLNYIKKWVPETGSANYPEPVVEHSFARDRALQTYKKYLKDGQKK